ncbi:retrovirus-related Pol polyprotein from transposon TNT 1-94, partial [Trifolium pratense]
RLTFGPIRSMAAPTSPTPSIVLPEYADATGILNPPPLRSFQEDETVFKHDLNFTLRITEKLTEKNFHLWRQQVEPYVIAHGLDDFLVAPTVPPQFLTATDHATATLNPAYRKWRQQDQMLLSWLQTTLSNDILARFLGSRTSQDLWDPLPLSQHMDIILEGLPSEFNSVISVVESQFASMDLDEIEALLLAHENCLEKSKKKTIDDAASINIAQNPQSNPPVQEQTPDNLPIAENSYGTDSSKYGNDNSRYGPYSTLLEVEVVNMAEEEVEEMVEVAGLILIQPQHYASFHGSQQAPPPGYFQEAYGPYSGQNFPPRFGSYYGYGAPNYNPWPNANPPLRFPTPPNSHPSAMISNGPSTSTFPAWYPDSGASFHVTGDSRNIQEPSPYAAADLIYMGH